jgi:hypothetical protein
MDEIKNSSGLIVQRGQCRAARSRRKIFMKQPLCPEALAVFAEGKSKLDKICSTPFVCGCNLSVRFRFIRFERCAGMR